MGSSSSKLKKYLNHGDEYAAMQVFQGSPELQRNLNPNASYGESYNHNTAMHLAAKHGMKHLLRTFMCDLGGNPNKKNGSNQTSLHAACQLLHNKTMSAMDRRAACVALILQWRGAVMEDGNREKVDLAAQDAAGDTALHLAASSGMECCVEALLAAGSPIYTENKAKLTPCDLAVKNGHDGIAHILESKMVFSDASDIHNEDELSQCGGDEVYTGLRAQDLQEAKDQLLVETSDMLQVPLFTAEALLRDNEWSREVLLEKWMKDAVACCQLAGVQPTESALLQHAHAVPAAVATDDSPHICDERITDADVQCGICLMVVKIWDQPNVHLSCGHNFCTACWEAYLSSKILEGMYHDILCPAFDCSILVPLDVIERLVTPDLNRRYLHFDIKAFVDNNKCIKWCPVAGCGRAVKLPDIGNNSPRDQKTPPSHAVDCGIGHFFCWDCLGEAHAPSSCTQWRLWLEKVNQVRPEELNSSLKDMEVASNCLWLVSNSKPCPNCKSPIQKNEGCNHIKCSKCRHDFCWVCLEAWKKHSSATGGYFRCNRFPATSETDEKPPDLYSEVIAKSRQIQDMNRFIHYYTRFRNHENSRKLEEPLLTGVKHKMEVLASSLVGSKEPVSEKDKICTKFIEDGVRELLKARRVLCGSYVHGFYLEDHGYNRTIFEFMQNELENVTEKLSEQIARPYLKTPRHTIMATTAMARRKRHELVRAVAKGLVPPDSPPARRHRRRRFSGVILADQNNDDMVSHAIAASLKSLDPSNPRVKDVEGRQANLSAIYEWPDNDPDGRETDVNRAVALSLVGECRREGCMQPRARNPRTNNLHDYCSLWCAGISNTTPVTHDDSMDLAIALEMSRLQMIEDSVKRQCKSAKKPKKSDITQAESETELSKAIELSLQQQTVVVGVATDTPIELYQKSNQDCFLKTETGLDSVNLLSFDMDQKILAKKNVAIFRPKHEDKGGLQAEEGDLSIRKALSTGDLTKGNALHGFHLDLKDHSCQHPKAENSSMGATSAVEIPAARLDNCVDLEVRRIMSPEQKKDKLISVGRRHTVGNRESSTIKIAEKRNSLDENRRSSINLIIDQVKNTLDSVDKEKSGGSACWHSHFHHFDSNGGEFSRYCPERASTGKIKHRPENIYEDFDHQTKSVATLLNLKEYEHKRYSTKRVMFLGSDRSLNDAHKQAFKAAGGKILHKKDQNAERKSSSLRILIDKNSLPTDSSNEYETETGIPKSPTLFISGVSISRSPEPWSPSTVLKSPERKVVRRDLSNLHGKIQSSPVINLLPLSSRNYRESLFPPDCGARQSRSSSLTVPKATNIHEKQKLNTSCGVLPYAECYHSGSMNSTPSLSCGIPSKDAGVFTFGVYGHKNIHDSSFRRIPSVEMIERSSGVKEDFELSFKSKSFAGAERDRESFRLPKSSTDGALSSVLHVQESNLSSDDFHEALFLRERSPTQNFKRRKRTKKEREKFKEGHRRMKEANF